jgi:FAD/FMN-containing dehydrogenase
MPDRNSGSAIDAAGAGLLLTGIERLLGDGGLLTDPGLLDRYSRDWTGKSACRPVAVARPRSTAEVAAVLAHCHAEHWPVVIQGGLTGLVGGSTPHPGELALSLERLSGVEELDVSSGHMIVRAGTTLAVVQDAALGQGMSFALDLPARGTCTIGGNVATNAGGNRVIRYGMTRSLVLGLEAVLADGTVLTSLGTVMKDNAGYDLKQLFIGTEGTLGVVTRAALRLHPEPPERLTALVALASFGDLVALLATLRRILGPTLCAFEAMWDSYFECVLVTNQLARPFSARHAFYALIEVELLDPAHERDRVENVLFQVLERGWARDAIIAASLEESARLWQIRESAGEMLGKLAPTVAHDISMPLDRMESFVEELRVRCDSLLAGRPFCAFGHLGDGNLHLFTALRSPDDAEAMDALVYGALAGFGSVSAEHGVGMSKKKWLGVTRTAAEIAVMRSMKQHLDPRGILNPGRVI